MNQAAAAVSEATLYEWVRDLARTFGLRIYHTHDSHRSYSGFPDVVIVGRSGILFRELKKTGEHPTSEQRAWLAALEAAGADAGVWRPADWLSQRIHAEVARIRQPSFTCPRCQAVSYHPEDLRQGYCGRCHDFTGKETGR